MSKTLGLGLVVLPPKVTYWSIAKICVELEFGDKKLKILYWETPLLHRLILTEFTKSREFQSWVYICS